MSLLPFHWNEDDLKEVLGLAYDFIMDDGGFEIEQKINIFGIILCNFHIFASERFDRFKIFPEGECHKMSDGALTSFQDMNAKITLHRLIVCDGTRIQEFAIG